MAVPSVPSLAKLDPNAGQLLCEGLWNLANLSNLQTSLKKLPWPTSGELSINGAAVSKLDTAGAWLLLSKARKLKARGLEVRFKDFSGEAQKLLTFVEKKTASAGDIPPINTPTWVARVGKKTCDNVNDFFAFLNFTGRLFMEWLHILSHPKHFRWNPTFSAIDKTGFQALGIIALLSFMIGVVIAYQMGFQLRNYGANVFIVNLLGLSVLREFGPLLGAIMVAGRTGSAFTAQLGIMRINQEVDALDTMGITSGELLLLPRIFGLFIALPLLTMWADIFGILGGMLMANSMLGVTWYDFLIRFQREIPVRSLLLGLGKAPIFALLIAGIGCFEGMRVVGSADSVGTKTTRSVVLSIFFIILADAVFSIIFSKLRL